MLIIGAESFQLRTQDVPAASIAKLPFGALHFNSNPSKQSLAHFRGVAKLREALGNEAPRLCWCLVKQIYGALIGASTVRLNSTKELPATLTPKGASGAFFCALEPTKESGIGGYMPSYIVTAYCEKCSVNHPTGVELNWPEQIPPDKKHCGGF